MKQNTGNKEYKLVAFDMDGTLLDSNKKIRPDSLEAISRAANEGKYIALSTGRNLKELASYRAILPKVQYIMAISGALIIDNKTDNAVFESSFKTQDVIDIFDIGLKYGEAIHLHGRESHMQKDHISKMQAGGMGVYIPMFEKLCTFHEDIYKEYKQNPYAVYKFNFYCKNQQDRAALKQELSSLPITMCYAETKSLECSPLGISKASGLAALCDYLGIDISETIAVGDADNDLEILKAAGLGIAMGNANDNVKAIAGAVVADCDSGGIAQIINEYLIK